MRIVSIAKGGTGASTAVQARLNLGIADTSFSGVYGDLTGIPETFPPAAHTQPASTISDSTATGRAVLTAANQLAARAAIGAGTSSFSGAYSDLTGIPSLIGGSFAAKQTTVTLPFPARHSHSVTVSDLTVAAASKIVLSLAGVPETAENSSDMIDVLGMMAIPASGSFQFQANFLTPFAGPLTINYAVG